MGALAKTESFSLTPTNLTEAMDLCKILAQSDLVPKDYKGKPGNVLVAIQMGAEVGLSPMQAIQGIAVINGRPTMWGDALLALVQGHETCEDVIETLSADGRTATCIVKRRGRAPITRTFSEDDARKAGLLGKQGPWSQYPKRMLQMRARSFALRDSFADVLRGIGMAEEAQDIPTTVTATATQRPSAPQPALPPHDATTGEVIDSEIDPFDFVIPTGKNAGKALRELANNQLHWYAEEFQPRNEDGHALKRNARAVIDARKAERELERAKVEAEQAKAEEGDGWYLAGDANEAEAEAMASAHDE